MRHTAIIAKKPVQNKLPRNANYEKWKSLSINGCNWNAHISSWKTCHSLIVRRTFMAWERKYFGIDVTVSFLSVRIYHVSRCTWFVAIGTLYIVFFTALNINQIKKIYCDNQLLVVFSFATRVEADVAEKTLPHVVVVPTCKSIGGLGKFPIRKTHTHTLQKQQQWRQEKKEKKS